MEKTFYDQFMEGADFELVHECIRQLQMPTDDLPSIPLHERLGLLPSEYRMLVDNESKFQRYLELVREQKS
jgi:hypothetical protein